MNKTAIVCIRYTFVENGQHINFLPQSYVLFVKPKFFPRGSKIIR